MNTAVAASHRERKKQATRQAIHQAAFELVDELGLANVTVEAISEQAGVAPRTFWSYFSSKEEAVVNRDPDLARDLRAALLGRPESEDPLTAVRRVLEQHIVERFSASPDPASRHKLIHREPHLMATVAAIFDEMARALVDTVAERLGTDPEADMFPEVVVFTALGACRVAQQRWAGAGCRQPFTEVVDEAFDKLTAAVAPTMLERQA